MPRFGQFSASIVVDGTQATEHNVRRGALRQSDGAMETRCAIESKTDTHFHVEWTYDPDPMLPRMNVIGRLLVDGKSMCRSGSFALPGYPDILHCYVDQTHTMWPLKFAPIRLLEAAADLARDGSADRLTLVENERAKDVGTIVLEIWTAVERTRAHAVPFHDGRPNAPPPKQVALLERQKKHGVFLTHTAQFGDPVPPTSLSNTYHETIHCCAVFVFEYASRSFLELAGHIPAPAPAPKIVITLSDDDEPKKPRARKLTVSVTLSDDDDTDGESVATSIKSSASRSRSSPSSAQQQASPGATRKIKREQGESVGLEGEQGAAKRRRISGGTASSASTSRQIVELIDSDSDDDGIVLVAGRVGKRS